MKNFIAAALFSLVLTACGDGINPAPNGEACELSEDCESGLCKTNLGEGTEFEQDLIDGLCTVDCDPLTSEGCDLSAEVCLIYIVSDEANCYQRCNPFDEDPCREGWGCENLGFFIPSFICLPEFALSEEVSTSQESMLININTSELVDRDAGVE